MNKKIFALATVSFMVLIGLGATSVSADPDGTIYGTVFFEVEDDWGDVQTIAIAGVAVTITRSDGDTRTDITDSRGYYSHTVSFERYETYTVSVDTIAEYSYNGKTYRLSGTSEGAMIRWLDKTFGAKQVVINMPAREVEESKERSVTKTMPMFQNIFANRLLVRNMFRGLFEGFIN